MNRRRANIELFDNRWGLYVPGYGHSTATIEQAGKWLRKSGQARLSRWQDILDGQERPPIDDRMFNDFPDLVQAILLADLDGES